MRFSCTLDLWVAFRNFEREIAERFLAQDSDFLTNSKYVKFVLTIHVFTNLKESFYISRDLVQFSTQSESTVAWKISRDSDLNFEQNLHTKTWDKLNQK